MFQASSLLAEVENAGGDGDLLGGLEGALDLVHGSDAVGFFGVDEVDIRGNVAGEVDGLVERGSGAGVAEPCGDVADGGAVGVVEVMTGGEDLDGLCATVFEGVEQAGVQTLLEKDVSGDSRLHYLLRYSSRGVQGIAIRLRLPWGALRSSRLDARQENEPCWAMTVRGSRESLRTSRHSSSISSRVSVPVLTMTSEASEVQYSQKRFSGPLR